VRPLIPQSRPKRPQSGFESRTVPEEETRQKYLRFVDAEHGIVSSLCVYDLPWDGAIYVARATLRPESCASRSSARPAIGRSVLGKGLNRAACEVSAICEALERYSGIYRGDEDRYRASYSDLSCDAIHPSSCTLFSEQQYRNRTDWNRLQGAYNWVPERFDERRPIDWTPVWSLTHDRQKYVPSAYCYFGYPFDSSHDFCRPDSNGNSAGDNLEEAILHAFLELVERECVALWWYNRILRPAVDLESFDLEYVKKLQGTYRSLGRSIHVLNISANAAIAAFAAISRSEDSTQPKYILGFGAHLDPRLALLKALTEMNQFLPEVLAREPGSFLLTSTNDSFLQPSANLRVARLNDFAYRPTKDLRDDVMACIDLVRQWNLEMLVLDQTRSDIDLPVVKVIVAGMRPWWARFGPGRLYWLPVQLKWLESPLAESQLNLDHIRL
jgi:oxazoline/thiazoline synthase